MKFELPKIYPITDRQISGLSHLEQVERLAAGGATFIQLRDKTAHAGEFHDEASAVVEYARTRGITIIVNDRVDIALASGAGGVHLGQDDLPPGQARELLGPDTIIGYSTHSVEQAIAAADLPIDYIAIGPVFETSTKDKPDPTVGLNGISAVRSAIGVIPLVAIGGIDLANVNAVLSAGADSASLISALLSNANAITDRISQALSR